MSRVSVLRRSFPTPFLMIRLITKTRRRIVSLVLVLLAIVAGPPIWWAAQLIGLTDVGDPFDVAAFKAFTIPDDQNAFVLYREATTLLDPDLDYSKRSTRAFPDIYARWSKAVPEVRRWIEDNGKALAVYRRGADRPDAFTSEVRFDHASYIPLQVLRLFSPMILLEASRLEEAGDMAGAWLWYRAMLRTIHHLGMHGTIHNPTIIQYLYRPLRDRLKTWAADPRTTPALLRQALGDVAACEALAPSELDSLKAGYLDAIWLLDQPDNPGHQVPLSRFARFYNPNYTLNPEQIQAIWDWWRFWRREPERSRRVIRLVAANWLAYHDLPPADRPKPDPKVASFDIYPLGPRSPASARALTPQALDRWYDTAYDAQQVLSFLNATGVRIAEQANDGEILVLLGTELYRRDHGTDPPALEALVGPYLERLPAVFQSDPNNDSVPGEREQVTAAHQRSATGDLVMSWIRILSTLFVLSILDPAVASEPADGCGSLHLRIIERGSNGQLVPVPARIHLADDHGKPILPPGLPAFNDHFNCDGEAKLDLAAGPYTYAIERGPEYRRAAGRLEVEAGMVRELQVVLERTIDLAAHGWYSGETHVHRPPDEMPLLMRSEDLHVAPLLTVWNSTNYWKDRPLPARLMIEVEPTRVFHLLACEDERQGGALLYFNLRSPLVLSGDGPEFPSPVTHLREALEQPGAWVDVEKPFWWDMPVWVATGKVRSIGLANNHMLRGGMHENEAWGRPRDRVQFPGPRGNGFYSQALYYRLLNCGLRIPPSAGSASGVLANPVGYNRAYVHLDGPFSYEDWWKGLGLGRSFVTNGPLLKVLANGEDPGHTFRAPAGATVTVALDVQAGGNDPLEAIEIIRDGAVVERLAGKALPERAGLKSVAFDRSGWFLVRAIADVPATFRFASTAPFYVEVGDRPRTVHRADVAFFLEWIDARISALNEDRQQRLVGPGRKAAVLEPHREARRFFEGLLRGAE